MTYFFFLSLLLCFSYQAYADEGLTQQQIERLLKKNHSLQKVKKIAQESDSKGLLHAVRATQNMQRGLGISRKQFLQTAFFIETRLEDLVEKKKYYLTKQKTGLSHTLEYDPLTKSCFIVLEGKRNYIGEGTKKTVSKVICYDSKQPQTVARAEERIHSSRELRITKALHGKPGIFQTLGFGRHKAHGKSCNVIYSTIYNPGALQNAFESKIRFCMREKMKIALNILKGVEAMHEQGIVHRDLGARNYLINIPKGKIGKRKIEACVADLGRADYAKNVAGTKVQGNTKYTPPEGLYLEKLKGNDYYAIDIYAVGCVFFRLFYDKVAPWQDKSYVKDTRSRKLCYHELVSRIKQSTAPRRAELVRKAKKGSLSAREQFERLVLRMVSPDPKKRGSAHYLRTRMEQILEA